MNAGTTPFEDFYVESSGKRFYLSLDDMAHSNRKAG